MGVAGGVAIGVALFHAARGVVRAARRPLPPSMLSLVARSAELDSWGGDLHRRWNEAGRLPAEVRELRYHALADEADALADEWEKLAVRAGRE